MRRYSASSVDLRSTTTHVETSAVHHLRADRLTIDYSAATSASAVDWSTNNVVVFARGNRVHYKSLSSNEDVGQLCKIRDGIGHLQLLSCGGKDQPSAVAICTNKGYIQIWDVSSKKMTLNWTTKGATAIKWNGPILTVGGERGTIRHFDTRIKDAAKLKEQTKKVTRHQAKICTLAWNDEGKYLASGDKSGLVHVWDSRQNTPLDVGEMVQRRKKMQHTGAITALAWCPWQSKILASGDSASDGSGTIRIWNISPSTAFSSNHPDKLELDAQITSLHWSTHCKEILSTHGPGKSTPVPTTPSIDINNEYFSFSNDPRPSRIANSVLIHSYPSLRNVATVAAASKNVAGSMLSPNGQRVLLAVPEEAKLKIWDVWGRCKELRRSNSVLSGSGIR
ncbi:WD40 repeat-like protein [Obba rivulosa]|uniref:WD40 repeat-like protein n=1 Tax=Obba rivulosa TaxID=1052685 RepID=A0A8E2B5P3_9APHY|nr:WD40 repeat-like protein [Obba rivulosa]